MTVNPALKLLIKHVNVIAFIQDVKCQNETVFAKTNPNIRPCPL